MTRYWWNDVLYGLAFLVGLLTRNVSGEDKSRIAKGDGFVMGGWSYIYGLVKDGQGWDENLGCMEWVIQIQYMVDYYNVEKI